MLCCELIHIVRTSSPPHKHEAPNWKLSGDGSAEILFTSGTKKIVKYEKI